LNHPLTSQGGGHVQGTCDGKRQYGNCVVVGMGIDDKTITLKNGKNEVITVTGPKDLFLYM